MDDGRYEACAMCLVRWAGEKTKHRAGCDNVRLGWRLTAYVWKDEDAVRRRIFRDVEGA